MTLWPGNRITPGLSTASPCSISSTAFSGRFRNFFIVRFPPIEVQNGKVCFLIEPWANIETDHALSGILLTRSPDRSLASHQTTPQMFARERRSHHVLLQQIERRSEQNEIFH